MFASTMMGGMCLGFPDVCKTPIPPAGPVPIPYPNIATGLTCNPATTAMTVLTFGMPTLNQTTQGTISNGDNAGVLGGVASQLMMGPQEQVLGSLTVMIGGSPTQKMTSLMGQNGMSMNCPGVSLVPSQVTLLVTS